MPLGKPIILILDYYVPRLRRYIPPTGPRASGHLSAWWRIKRSVQIFPSSIVMPFMLLVARTEMSARLTGFVMAGRMAISF
jgi:hypothetical protein